MFYMFICTLLLHTVSVGTRCSPLDARLFSVLHLRLRWWWDHEIMLHSQILHFIAHNGPWFKCNVLSIAEFCFAAWSTTGEIVVSVTNDAPIAFPVPLWNGTIISKPFGFVCLDVMFEKSMFGGRFQNFLYDVCCDCTAIWFGRCFDITRVNCSLWPPLTCIMKLLSVSVTISLDQDFWYWCFWWSWIVSIGVVVNSFLSVV